MTKNIKAYFAGWHVFRPDAKEWAENVWELCLDTCIFPVIPADGDVDPEPKDTLAMRIYNKNIELMRECDIVIADITPFRGISCDTGTAFEIGFFAALDKPIVLYSEQANIEYKHRAEQWLVLCEALQIPKTQHISLQCSIEDFGLIENLMIDNGDKPVFNSAHSAILYARQKFTDFGNNG